MVCALFCAGSGALAADDPKAPKCDLEALKTELDDFAKLDPQKDCRSLVNDRCSADDTGKTSICVSLYKMMTKAVEDYATAAQAYCSKVNAAAAKCKETDPAKIYSCLKDAYSQKGDADEGLSKGLKAYQAKMNLKKLKEKIDNIQGLYLNDRDAIGASSAGPQACGKDFKGIPYKPEYYNTNITSDKPEESVFQQLDNLYKKAEQFYKTTGTVAAKRDKDVIDSRQKADVLDGRARNMASQDPLKQVPKGETTNPKSDVTGSSKAPSLPSGGQPGGGPSGGKQGGEQPSGTGSEASATAPTPGSPNTSTPRTSDSTKKPDGGVHGDATNVGGSTTAKADTPKVGPGTTMAENVSLPGISSGSSTTPYSSGSGRESTGASSKPSMAGVAGGGGGGGIADPGAGIGEKHCAGKDCQALGSTGAQFAPIGSLGGSALGALDGLGSLDSGSSLDNLLKDDKKGGAGALDGMAGLDSSTAGLEAGAAGGGEGTQGSGIEGANGETLFARMHNFHVRAQKRGMVVGLTRKL